MNIRLFPLPSTLGLSALLALAPAMLRAAGPPPNGPGSALSFNGVNDHLTAAPLTLPVGNSPYTIEAWINTTAMNAGTIAAWGNFGSPNQVNAFRLTPTGLVNYWWANDLLVTANLVGAWHHVAATFDGTTRRILVDGVVLGSDAPLGHNAGGGKFSVGAANGVEFFSGQMDEVRIWTVGRTATQIQEAMRRQLFGNESGLVACWRLDEGTGLSAFDATGNANNTATLVNGPSWVASTIVPFAPPVTTLAASSVTGSSATLNGQVDGRTSTSAFEAYFEWGTTTSLGNELHSGFFVSAGAAPQVFSFPLTGLVPSTTYYYRAVAVNGSGPGYGTLQTIHRENDYILVAGVIAGGGGQTSGGGYLLNGTIGQWEADPMAAQTAAVSGGFWAVAERPRLRIQLTGNSVVIAWPAVHMGFQLQQSPALAGPLASWGTVAQPVTLANGENQVTVSVISGTRFFRLRKP